jgi:phenol 2-monooxygenase (NADPH)
MLIETGVIAVDYGVSVIVAKEGDSTKQGDGTDVMGKESLRVVSKQDLAKDVKVGMRMPSFKVLNQADARPWHFQELLKSRGCWRIVIFAGNMKSAQQKARIEKLGRQLRRENSFLTRFTPANKRYDSVIEVLTVHSAPRQETTIFDFPPVLRPWDKRDGWDYWKIFVDDQSYHEGHGHAYQNYGVDPERGCAIVLRPDQYVSLVTEVDDYEGLDHFFSGFMVEQKQQNGSIGKVPEANGNGTIADAGPGRNGINAGDEASKRTGGF